MTEQIKYINIYIDEHDHVDSVQYVSGGCAFKGNIKDYDNALFREEVIGDGLHLRKEHILFMAIRGSMECGLTERAKIRVYKQCVNNPWIIEDEHKEITFKYALKEKYEFTSNLIEDVKV